VYEPRTWTNLGAIFLPGLTAPRHENRKIRYENELLKARIVIANAIVRKQEGVPLHSHWFTQDI
jgi:hypothetical protein